MRAKPAIVAVIFALAACNRVPATADAGHDADPETRAARGEVTVAGDDSIAAMLTWGPPMVMVDDAGIPGLGRKGARPVAEGHL